MNCLVEKLKEYFDEIRDKNYTAYQMRSDVERIFYDCGINSAWMYVEEDPEALLSDARADGYDQGYDEGHDDGVYDEFGEWKAAVEEAKDLFNNDQVWSNTFQSIEKFIDADVIDHELIEV